MCTRSPCAIAATGVSVVLTPPSLVSARQYDSISARPSTGGPPGGRVRASSAYSAASVAGLPALNAVVQAAVGSAAASTLFCGAPVGPQATARAAIGTAMLQGHLRFFGMVVICLLQSGHIPAPSAGTLRTPTFRYTGARRFECRSTGFPAEIVPARPLRDIRDDSSGNPRRSEVSRQ